MSKSNKKNHKNKKNNNNLKYKQNENQNSNKINEDIKVESSANTKALSNVNKFTFYDSSKVFLYDIVLKTILSFVLVFVLSGIANAKGFSYNDFITQNSFLAYFLTLFTPMVLFFVVWLYSKSNKKNAFELFKPKSKIDVRILLLVIEIPFVVLFMCGGFFNYIDYLFSLMGYSQSGTVVYMPTTFFRLLAGIFSMAILPAVIEEWAYRGVILNGLNSKFKPYVAIIISTILFTLMHGSLSQTFYQLFLGLIFAFVVYISGNLIYSIIMHFINNALVLVINYFNTESVYLVGGDFSNVWYIISQILLFIGGVGVIICIVYFIKKYYNENKLQQFESQNYNFKDLVTKTNKNEKIVFFGGLIIALLIWIVETCAGFGVD